LLKAHGARRDRIKELDQGVRVVSSNEKNGKEKDQDSEIEGPGS
jgi:hypothetical protein